MNRIATLWAVLLLSVCEIEGQSIAGIVQDAETREKLPFATVGFKGTSVGTITNKEGYFELLVPEAFRETEIAISYMGYETAYISPENFGNERTQILLKPSVLTLKELVIRPLSPEDYIKRVVRNQAQAEPQEPYTAKAYYREKFLENGGYLAFNEGIFKFHNPAANDTAANQYQLMLYETAKDPQELHFMSTFADKKEAKAKKKAARKGETYEEDDESDLLHVSFGGPEQILAMDMYGGEDAFLDSTQFRKFRYSFGQPVTYQGRDLLVIDFESKGKVDHVRNTGKIYIDVKLDAFAIIEYTGELVIPILIEPALFAFGISISNPQISKSIRFQFLNDRWYPEHYVIEVATDLKKRYLFDANEESKFEIDQVLKVSDIITPHDVPISQEKRFDSEKDPEEQIVNDEGLKWEDFNRIIDETTSNP